MSEQVFKIHGHVRMLLLMYTAGRDEELNVIAKTISDNLFKLERIEEVMNG